MARPPVRKPQKTPAVSGETPAAEAGKAVVRLARKGLAGQKPVRLTGASALDAGSAGAFALGALALGAMAVGAVAIGALAIGRLGIGRARIRRLEIDELVIRSRPEA